MRGWTITYKGTDYRFPNFTNTLKNTLDLEPRPFQQGGGDVMQAVLDKTCQLIGNRKKDFSDDEKTQFTNFLLNERGIFGGTGTSEWDEFKNSTAQITVAFNQSILSADFTDIETNLDEILSWLAEIKSSLTINREKIVVFKDNDQAGCGNGRCREKACHETEFWKNTKAYYDDMLVQVNQQISYVNSVKSTINQIEDGTLDTGDLSSTVDNNAERLLKQREEEEAQARRKKLMLVGGIVLGLLGLVFIIRKIRNR